MANALGEWEFKTEALPELAQRLCLGFDPTITVRGSIPRRKGIELQNWALVRRIPSPDALQIDRFRLASRAKPCDFADFAGALHV
jgi:hypothetical protein